MQYLVQMRLAGSGRPGNEQDGAVFIERFIFPTLEKCKELQAEGKILAGGPVSSAVALALIVNANSAPELDDLVTSLPIWPRMETTVTPLTTFDDRMQSLRPRLAQLKAERRGDSAESWETS